MISYREKQLLATMKYLQNETNNLSENMLAAISASKKGEPYSLNLTETVPVENYDELVQLAEVAGYDCYIRADDILSPEEIADLEKRKEAIEEEFESRIKLKKEEYVFLFSAVGLQLIKQVFLKLDLARHDIDAAVADDAYGLKYDSPKFVDGTEIAKRFYAPFQQIANTKTVPYDIVKNTKYFEGSNKKTGLGLNGDNHRFKSVGHDPLLGLLFGTANILTNTATFYVNPLVLKGADKRYLTKLSMVTFHVRYKDMAFYRNPYIASFASTILMFDKVAQRIKNDRGSVYIAFIKEINHIQSDKESIAGIPLPFFSQILGTEEAQRLAMKGFDWDHLIKNAAVIGKQASMTLTINAIISMLHRFYILWDQLKSENSIIDALKLYCAKPISDFDNIRTKKIVMYSDVIASSINLVTCVGGGLAGACLSSPELATKFISHLDIGGILITIGTLIKDSRYILKIKDDFIKSTINESFQKQLTAIETES